MLNLITDHLDVWASAELPAKAGGRGRAASNTKSPHGIQKLRELILELAVRGKLVAQDPSDEPTKALLDRIAQDKARLLAERKIGKTQPLPEILVEETPFEISASWEWVRLGDLGQIFNGNSISEHVKEEKYTCIKDGLSFIATKDVGYGWQRLNYENGVSIPAGEPNFKVACQGAVLICCEGGSAGKKCGITDRDICFGNKLYALEPHVGVSSHFLLASYLTPSFFAQFTAKMTGIIGGISLANFNQLLVSLPPINEQHRIVAKVDELMALCDQLEQEQTDNSNAHQTLVETLLATLTQAEGDGDFAAAWQRIAAHFDTLFTTEQSIDQLKQTILQLAVMGKLVPQDPNDEPASELLKRIQTEKARLLAEGKIKKDKPLPTIAKEEQPFELPKGWEWARFPELGEFGRGKSKHRPRNEPRLFDPGIYPLVQTGEVARAGNIIQEYHSKYSELGLAQSKMWPRGTLCITIAANIADSALLGFDACFPDSVVGFVQYAPLKDSRYFLHFMKTAREDLLKYAPSTAQKNINLEILESVLISIPPLNEISRIVAKVDELMAICDALKAGLNEAQITQVQLADALVEQAVA